MPKEKEKVPSPEEIRELRKRLGMTLEEMAQELGVSLQTVHLWEKGEVKPSRMAMKLLVPFFKKHKGKEAKGEAEEPQPAETRA